jgi:hypothetical protein
MKRRFLNPLLRLRRTVPPDLKRAFPLRLDTLLNPAEGHLTLIREIRLDLSQTLEK